MTETTPPQLHDIMMHSRKHSHEQNTGRRAELNTSDLNRLLIPGEAKGHLTVDGRGDYPDLL